MSTRSTLVHETKDYRLSIHSFVITKTVFVNSDVSHNVRVSPRDSPRDSPREQTLFSALVPLAEKSVCSRRQEESSKGQRKGAWGWGVGGGGWGWGKIGFLFYQIPEFGFPQMVRAG